MRKRIFFISILLISSILSMVDAETLKTYKELEDELYLIERCNPIIYYYEYNEYGTRIEKPYLISSLDITKLHNPAYGEDNQLGQFTDNFINETFIMSKYHVVRNSTLDCIEANFTEASIYSDDVYQLREHKCYADYNPDFTYSITSSSYVRSYSTKLALGHSYMFLVFNANYINGKYLRWRWRQYDSHSAPGVIVVYSWMFDGGYDRKSSTHFPSGSGLGTMGNGLLQTLGSTPQDTSWSDWEIEDWLIDVDGATLDNVTFMIRVHDAWSSVITGLEVDWVEVNDDSGGADNIATFDFDDSTNIVMEKTASTGDYGYVNNTGLPISTGGYDMDGYMITEDYLNYTDGSSLVLMTNSTIPIYTSLTVQFSNDNSTWVNNQNVDGYNTVVDGFLSLDLRNLNYTDIYTMYNFTGNTGATPRLYQSRMITTKGNATGGGVTTVYVYRFPSYSLIMLIFLLSIGLLIVYGVSKRR